MCLKNVSQGKYGMDQNERKEEKANEKDPFSMVRADRAKELFLLHRHSCFKGIYFRRAYYENKKFKI